MVLSSLYGIIVLLGNFFRSSPRLAQVQHIINSLWGRIKVIDMETNAFLVKFVNPKTKTGCYRGSLVYLK